MPRPRLPSGMERARSGSGKAKTKEEKAKARARMEAAPFVERQSTGRMSALATKVEKEKDGMERARGKHGKEEASAILRAIGAAAATKSGTRVGTMWGCRHLTSWNKATTEREGEHPIKDAQDMLDVNALD